MKSSGLCVLSCTALRGSDRFTAAVSIRQALKLVIFFRHSLTCAVIGHAPNSIGVGPFHVSSGRHCVFMGR
jgi:hypothetical protein